MSVEVRPSPQNDFGTLDGCFVEGTAEQRARERRIRRRALTLSVAVQTAVLTVVLLVPLLAKPARLNYNILTPIPPYAPARARVRQNSDPHTATQRNRVNINPYAAPNFIPPTVHEGREDATPDPPGSFDPNASIPCVAGCVAIVDNRAQPQRPPDVRPQTPQRIVVTHLEPALLVHRVEPEYPILAKQTHREGRVELRAIIATDGTIKSLQVVSGDALFLRSALDAVGQWRYRPTILSGQPVEVDTFITVVYSLHQ